MVRVPFVPFGIFTHQNQRDLFVEKDQVQKCTKVRSQDISLKRNIKRHFPSQRTDNIK